MSFVLSKILWALLTPGTLLFLILAVAFVLAWRRALLSATLFGLATVFTGLLVVAPVAHWVAGPLEQRFPPQPLPAQVDGIVVLGGAVLAPQAGDFHEPSLNGQAERLIEAAVLARRFPEAKVLYSGGSGLLQDADHREADYAGPILEWLGVERSRLLLERDSRNTWENALESKKLAAPKPGEHWLLVTSAWHMPRAVGCFRAAGWADIIPHPVDYIGGNPHWLQFEPEYQLLNLSLGVKEWIGLAAYHLLHRTDAWFPAPAPPPR